MTVLDAPLARRATVAWRDGSTAPVTCLRDVNDLGLPAVVSLTERRDLESRKEFEELSVVAQDLYFVDLIIATVWWRDPANNDFNLKLSRRLASAPNVSLALVVNHVTGLVAVDGADVCWDYNTGTPRHQPKGYVNGVKVPLSGSYPYIGRLDWVQRAKASFSIPSGALWHGFVK